MPDTPASAHDHVLSPRRLLKSGGIITVMSVLTFLGTILTNVLTAKFFGTGPELDAFIVALSIPTLMVTLPFLGGVQTFMIPRFLRIRANESEDAAWDFFNSYTTFVLLCGLLVAGAGAAVPGALVRAFAPGLDPVHSAAAARLVPWLQLTVPFNLAINLAVGILYSYKHIYLPSLAQLIVAAFNVALFLTVGDAWGVWILVGITLSGVLGLGLMLAAYWNGIFSRFRFRFDFNAALFRVMTIPLLSLSAIGLFGRLNLVADRYFASSLGPGRIAVYEYASKLIPVIVSIFAVNLLKPMFAYLSESAAKAETRAELKENFLNAWRMTLVVFVPVVFTFLALRKPAFALLYEYGRFSGRDLDEVSRVCFFLGLAYLFWGLRHPMMLAFCAMEQAHKLGAIMASAVCLNVFLNWIWVARFGLTGLAAASSISAVAGWTAMTFFLRRAIPYSFAEISGPLFRVVLCSAAGGAAARLVYGLLPEAGAGKLSILLRLAAGSAAGAASCGVLYLAAGVPEARRSIEILRSRFGGAARGAA